MGTDGVVGIKNHHYSLEIYKSFNLSSRYATSSVLPVNPKLSWIIQECPSFLVPFYLLVTSSKAVASMNSLVLSLMIIHYFQRSFIYAFLIRSSKPVPISITVMAFLFCTWNGFQQGLSLTQVNQVPGDFLSPNILVGVGMWLLGFLGNLHADHILRNLRKYGETGYKIPRGGLFEYVSAANYFAETIEWSGFAIAAWNLPACKFTNSFLEGSPKKHQIFSCICYLYSCLPVTARLIPSPMVS